MDYNVISDMKSVMDIMDYTYEDLADDLDVTRVTVKDWLTEKKCISDRSIDDFYCYTFGKGIRLNKIKEQFYREDIRQNDEVLLFHGAKTYIDGKVRLDCNKKINDFGNGFYCGESLEQSAMFVAGKKESSLYFVKFKLGNLKCKQFKVDREWMLTVAYFRGKLKGYEDSKIYKHIAKILDGVDYVIAPIANNRMFEIIDSFIEGEITDVQCQHCLSATDLGNQYVFISEKALQQVELLEHSYLCDAEKEAYLNSKQDSYKMNMDKVKLARKQYRNQGEYIEDILK